MTSNRKLGPGFWAFIVLMLVLTALFAGLGYWQVERLAEKEALIAAVEEGMDAAPVGFPTPAEWDSTDTYIDPVSGQRLPFAMTYQPLSATGTWHPADTVLVYTSLGEPRGTFGGPGYWVMTPLALAQSGTVFVNRGFVPQDRVSGFDSEAGLPAGSVSIIGIGKPVEAAGAFTPQPDVAQRIDWVRDPARLAAFTADLPQPVYPITLDLPAGPAGTLPQGGETVVSFPNNHFGYALTWFGFAILTPILLLVWIRRQLRARRTGQ